ncbi:MAG: TIGR03619 family F420-dependent LLM class oxidoreductase [Acidimicrobiia bacterium]|nr:TIGR03619 family F420-dependent LLM class oxidoreductase [Acidimicrobiia bacterium]
MHTSITISGLGRLFGGDLGAVVDAFAAAEAAGVDQVVLADHVAIGARTDRYPFGRFPYGPEEPWPEPLTVLAAAAGVTGRVRLGTGILVAPLRPPLLLAKTAATLDALSGGRLDLGLGLGWQPEEFAGAANGFSLRSRVLDDTVGACKALWSAAPASFASETVTFDDLWCLPAPVQPDGPPLWFAGPAAGRNLARIVENDAGWLPIAGTPLTEIEDGVQALTAAGAPLPLRVRASPPDDHPETLQAWARAGVTHASFAISRHVDSPAAIETCCARLVDAVRSAA